MDAKKHQFLLSWQTLDLGVYGVYGVYTVYGVYGVCVWWHSSPSVSPYTGGGGDKMAGDSSTINWYHRQPTHRPTCHTGATLHSGNSGGHQVDLILRDQNARKL